MPPVDNNEPSKAPIETDLGGATASKTSIPGEDVGLVLGYGAFTFEVLGGGCCVFAEVT